MKYHHNSVLLQCVVLQSPTMTPPGVATECSILVDNYHPVPIEGSAEQTVFEINRLALRATNARVVAAVANLRPHMHIRVVGRVTSGGVIEIEHMEVEDVSALAV